MARRIHPVGGKVALITGAAHGIGAAAGHTLAARGARVALLDSDGDAVARTAAACPGSAAFVADVTDRSQVDRALEEVLERFGGVDVVVANAGIAAMGFARFLDPDDFERVIAVNLLGSWNTLSATLPHLVARRGYALAISSVTAMIHVPGLAAYSASKAGLEAMCNALRVEVAHREVDIGVAYFSWIDTAMVRGANRSALGSGLLAAAKPPLHRVYPVQDAADAVLRAVERRSRTVSHPPALRALLPLRGVLQPLVDAQLRRLAPGIEAAAERAAARRPERSGAGCGGAGEIANSGDAGEIADSQPRAGARR